MAVEKKDPSWLTVGTWRGGTLRLLWQRHGVDGDSEQVRVRGLLIHTRDLDLHSSLVDLLTEVSILCGLILNNSRWYWKVGDVIHVGDSSLWHECHTQLTKNQTLSVNWEIIETVEQLLDSLLAGFAHRGDRSNVRRLTVFCILQSLYYLRPYYHCKMAVLILK